MYNKHQRNLEHLAKIAEAVPKVANARIAAMLTIGNVVISFGTNKRKSHPLQSLYGRNQDSIYLHAEIDAIKNSLRHVHISDLTKSTLYVTRVKYEDTRKEKHVWGLAKPCEGCMRAICNFGIRSVYYSCDSGLYDCIRCD